MTVPASIDPALPWINQIDRAERPYTYIAADALVLKVREGGGS